MVQEDDEIKIGIIKGDIRITESKAKKTISYKAKFDKEIFEDEKPIEGNTKEKMLKQLLSDIYDKYPNKTFEFKVNFKSFIKDYNYFKVRYNNLSQQTATQAKLSISEIKEQNSLLNNIKFIKIKDNINLVE